MSEAERIDRAARRKLAEARLARSRPAREAAAAAHAGRVSAPARSIAGDAAFDPTRSPVLSRLERKILDAANDILVARGDEGRRLAELIRNFVAADAEA